MFTEIMNQAGLANPWAQAALFVAASLLMLWRLEALIARGLEGTALATIVTPFCSGLGNLLFVFLVLNGAGDSREVVTNCLVNNVTNLTLLLGLPAVLWGLQVLPRSGAGGGRRAGKALKADVERRVGRLSLLLTLAAAAFFTGALWLLGADGVLGTEDGLILCGLFVFWLCFQVFDVLKTQVRKPARLGAMLVIDLLLLGVGALLMYTSLEWLVEWLGSRRDGFLSADRLGWLSAWLMVLPNALLALWYALRDRADVVYASQVGDGHICIPFCLGLCALFKPVRVPAVLEPAVLVLLGAAALHFLLLAVWGGVPRWAGAVLLAAYGVFLWAGLA